MKDNNSLLAEYLGLETKVIHALLYWMCELPRYKTLWTPDTNWSQLMMVVIKIMRDYNNPIKFQLYSKGGPIIGASFKLFDGMYICKETEDPIDSVYNACVEYIKAKDHE